MAKKKKAIFEVKLFDGKGGKSYWCKECYFQVLNGGDTRAFFKRNLYNFIVKRTTPLTEKAKKVLVLLKLE